MSNQTSGLLGSIGFGPTSTLEAFPATAADRAPTPADTVESVEVISETSGVPIPQDMPRSTPPNLPPAAAAIRQQAARYGTPAPTEPVVPQQDSTAAVGSLAAPPSITINFAALADAGRSRAGDLAGAMQSAAAPPPVPTEHRKQDLKAGWLLRTIDDSGRIPARELLAAGRRWRLAPGDRVVLATAEPEQGRGSTANVVTISNRRLPVPQAVRLRSGIDRLCEVVLLPLAPDRWAIIPASDLLPALAALAGQHPDQPLTVRAATSARVIPITSKEHIA